MRLPVTSLPRKAAAEAIGTGLLVAAVIGSGIAAQRLSPDQIGLQLLENSLATGFVLAGLIVALQPVSAAFNPVVTLIERALSAITTKEAAVLICAQTVGALVGAVIANLMFGLAPVSVSTTHRGGAGVWFAEIIATAGLVIVILGAARSGRASQVGYLVGGYIAGAYWFTSSTSFANPAVTIARTITDTFAGIAPISAPAFVVAQVAGGAVGLAAIAAIHPMRSLSVNSEGGTG